MVQFPASHFGHLLIQCPMTAIQSCRVTPFGYPGINGCLLLTQAFRSLPRPSSSDSAKASTMDPFSLDHIIMGFGRWSKPRSIASQYIQGFNHLGQIPISHLYLCKRTALTEINFGGMGNRTPDIQLAKLTLYQLSYTPQFGVCDRVAIKT